MLDGQPLDRPHLHQLRRAPPQVRDPTGVEAATSVALALASSPGMSATSASVLHAGANVSLRLSPAGVVARVVAEVGRWRDDDGWPDASRDVAVARAAAAHGGPVIAPLPAPVGGPQRSGGRIVSLWEAG